jgi:uncharacterized protein
MIIKKIIPTPEKLKAKRGMKRIGTFLENYPAIFVMNRKTVALGFAIGVSMGVLPLPLQLLTSIMLVILTGSNICAMFFGSLIANPLTLPIIYLVAYKIGSLFLSTETNNLKEFTFSISAIFNQNAAHLTNFFLHVGKALLIGLPVEGFILWIISFFTMTFLWKLMVIREYKKRKKSRRIKNENIIEEINIVSLPLLNEENVSNLILLEKELEDGIETFKEALKDENQMSI